MPYRYSMYLRYIHYNKILDAWWYDDLKKKLNLLEDNKIKINISELNQYLYQRYMYEQGNVREFDDTKYNLENFMKIIPFIKTSGYDADDEMQKIKYTDFVKTMDILADKLDKFCISY